MNFDILLIILSFPLLIAIWFSPYFFKVMSHNLKIRLHFYEAALNDLETFKKTNAPAILIDIAEFAVSSSLHNRVCRILLLSSPKRLRKTDHKDIKEAMKDLHDKNPQAFDLFISITFNSMIAAVHANSLSGFLYRFLYLSIVRENEQIASQKMPFIYNNSCAA